MHEGNALFDESWTGLDIVICSVLWNTTVLSSSFCEPSWQKKPTTSLKPRCCFFTACNALNTYRFRVKITPKSKSLGHYNPSVRIIDLFFHTTYVLCVNFIYKWRVSLQFKVYSEQQIFEKFFLAIFIYSQSFCKKSNERKLP